MCYIDFTGGKKLHFRCPVTFDREDHKCDSQIGSTRGLKKTSTSLILIFI